MSDRRPGCLLGWLLPTRRALTAFPRLPARPSRGVHADDLPGVVAAHRRAAQCMELLSQRADQGGAADVAQALVELFGQVVAIAGRLEQGRSFLHAHTSEALARERTDLELGALEADAAQLRQIAASRRSLERRAVVSRKVAADVGRLSGRLLAASEEIEALYARIVESVASPELGYEVRAYVTAAQAAMDAYEATAEEMSALDS